MPENRDVGRYFAVSQPNNKMSDKTEYEQVWIERIQQIELAISEGLIRGDAPDTLIATSLTIDQLCDYLGVVPDWKNPDGRALAFGDDGEVVLRIYRSVDVEYGRIIIR